MNAYLELFRKHSIGTTKVIKDPARPKSIGRRVKIEGDELQALIQKVKDENPDCPVMYDEQYRNIVVGFPIEHIANRCNIKWAWVNQLMLPSGYTYEHLIEFLNGLLSINYDDGFGIQELSGMIAYNDGSWRERHEYDGSEWWEFKRTPEEPDWDELREIWQQGNEVETIEE